MVTSRNAGKRRGERNSVPVIQAVERAARILLAFTVERPALGLSDLARQVGLSKSTVRRFLLTLERVGFVTCDATSGQYRPGLSCLGLGAVAHASLDLRQQALPIMRRLVQDLGETVYLLVPRGPEAICVEIAEARRGVRVLVAEVGTAFPLHAGAAPRALLAASPAAVVRTLLARPLRRYTPATMTRPAMIERDIETTRARGFCLSLDDLVLGIAGVGVVVRDRHGEPAAAISVSGMKARFLGPEGPGLIRAVVDAAWEISRAIGSRVDAPGAGSGQATARGA